MSKIQKKKKIKIIWSWDIPEKDKIILSEVIQRYG